MKRIGILDGFRCVAILMVILDHYTATFTTEHTKSMYPHIALSLYPYGDKYQSYFENGYLGVELFFIISGFVIYLTLEKQHSFSQFIVKRLLRLFPLLLICSIITFCIPYIIDPEKKYLLFHRPVANFFPSLTFSDLWLWNKILGIHDKSYNVEYIDNAYWTLGIEMKFYIYIGIIYFKTKANFFKNWLCFTVLLVSVYEITLIISPNFSGQVFFYFKALLETTFFAKYVIYFTLGTVFYRLYRVMPISRFEYGLVCLSIIICAVGFMPLTELLALLVFSSLFLLFIYRPNYILLLESKPILFIGLISYPLYLIHQNLGVLIINLLANTVKISYPELFVLPTMLFMILAAYLLHVYIEVDFGRVLKKLFIFNSKTNKTLK